MRIYIKGVTPIEKNIIVVDEQGNEYEATYPKRAKGLVKNGRARFIDENKICLACPPDIISEDNMEDKNVNVQEDIKAAAHAPDDASLTVAEIVASIKELMNSNGYLLQALESLESTPPAQGPGDIAGAERAKAIADVVRCRETTNQQALRIYEKMYDDAVSDADSEKVRLAKMMLEFADRTDDQAVLYQKNEIMNTVKNCSGVASACSGKLELAKMMLEFANSTDDEDVLNVKNSIIETLNSFVESDS